MQDDPKVEFMSQGHTVNVYNTNKSISIWRVLAFSFVCFITLYVRTYPLRGPMPWESAIIAQKARAVVYLGMKQQFLAMAGQLAPQLSSEDKVKWAEQRTQETIRDEKNKFEGIVTQTTKSTILAASPHYRRHYLLEADPYYYYFLTRYLRDTGGLGRDVGDGYYFNGYRVAPHGVKEPMNWHPYLGYAWYRFLDFLRPGTAMMTALCFYPLAASLAIALVFFIFGFVYRLHLIGTTFGAIAMLLAPIFIQRSFLGWYDTDQYNYLFPMAILTMFFGGTEEARRHWSWGILGGLLTGIYSLFWGGWPFIWFLILGSGCFGTIFFLIAHRGLHDNPYLRFTVWYFLSSTFFLALFMSPVNMAATINEDLHILPKFALSGVDAWPSFFLTVGETRAISLTRMISLSGNYGTAAMAVIGWGLSLADAIRRRRPDVFCRWCIMTLIGGALFHLALSTERFVVLFVIPFSIFVALGAHHMVGMGQGLIQKMVPSIKFRKILHAALIMLVTMIVLPMSVITADVVGHAVRPIMNDTWYDSMLALRDKTPKNSLIYSSWPPGYFILALGERRTMADGGSQHRLEMYWLAKAFSSPDEKEAVGLFRMLSAGGLDCMGYLQTMGLKPSQIAKTILDMVPLSREAARAKGPSGITRQQANQLLALTHGNTPPPPAYVFLYNDMIEANPALTLPATWDIEKAEKLVSLEVQEKKIGFLKKSREPKRSYLETILPITEVWRYTPEADLGRQEGTKLYFKNGLIVDLATMESVVDIPDKQLNGIPEKLFYAQDGNFVEKTNTGKILSSGALLIKKGDTYTSVIADSKLIRSMMFRLYYLNGEGLKFFKPLFYEDNPETQTRILILEINWKAFEEATTADSIVTNFTKEIPHANT